MDLETIFGYVTCVYNKNWWLAYVLDKDAENSEVKVTLLHPQGPAHSYKYPNVPDVLVIPSSSILIVLFWLTITKTKTTFSKPFYF